MALLQGAIELPDLLITMAPGVIAVLISLYNWYLLQQGAVIDPIRFVNFGMLNTSYGGLAHRPLKKLYLPILLDNKGSKPGMVSNVEIIFEGSSGVNKIDMRARVEFQRTGSEFSIIEFEPQFPVFVPAKEGKVVTFECWDPDNSIIPANEELTCQIKVKYSKTKESTISFPFKIESEAFIPQNKVAWLRAYDVQDQPREITSDRDLLKDLLIEINQDALFENILNRSYTQFDRTLKYGGKKLVKLDLTHMSLSSLPESIAKFDMLQYLTLSRNLLTELPESIGELKKLKWLDLSNNKLSRLPESIGNLTDLIFLDLDSAGNFTTLPSSIGNLTKLTSLSMRGTKLATLPDEIGNLTRLTALWCSGSKLTYLPETLGNLTDLKELDLNQSKLISLPSSIGNLKKLPELDLVGNELESLPESIINLSNLRILELSKNNLSTLPEGLHKLSSLTKLNLSNNPLTSLSESVEESLKIIQERGVSFYR